MTLVMSVFLTLILVKFLPSVRLMMMYGTVIFMVYQLAA